MTTAEERFDEIARGYSNDPAVTTGTGFGSSAGLRVEGKIFAMVMHDGLVVKLPKDRVDELVASGVGGPFSSGQGRVMKEWVTIEAAHAARWPELVAHAYDFVAAAARGQTKG